jgi:hypothetical protein
VIFSATLRPGSFLQQLARAQPLQTSAAIWLRSFKKRAVGVALPATVMQNASHG